MGFLDDLGKSLNKVGKKTSEMANVAKIKLEITKAKGAIDKKYEELGSRIYFLSKEGLEHDESIDALIGEIDELFEKVKALEVEVAEAGNPKCPHCGAEVQEGVKFCGSCGKAVAEESNEKKCPNCGAVVGSAKFCNSCGTSIE